MNRISYNAKDIGLRIRRKRQVLQMSQEKLAEEADMSMKYISLIELGKHTMSAEILSNISIALSISTDYLLYGTDK